MNDISLPYSSMSFKYTKRILEVYLKNKGYKSNHINKYLNSMFDTYSNMDEFKLDWQDPLKRRSMSNWVSIDYLNQEFSLHIIPTMGKLDQEKFNNTYGFLISLFD